MLKAALLRMGDVFPSPVLMRGEDYQREGHVLNVRLSDGLLKARVKGSSSQIYDVHIDLKSWPATASRCSCPYRVNCKHAAACLFELQAKEHQAANPGLPNPLQKNDWRTASVYSTSEEIFDADTVEWYSTLNEQTNDFFSYQLGIVIDNLINDSPGKRGNIRP